jgi:hypothetical protein
VRVCGTHTGRDSVSSLITTPETGGRARCHPRAEKQPLWKLKGTVTEVRARPIVMDKPTHSDERQAVPSATDAIKWKRFTLLNF